MVCQEKDYINPAAKVKTSVQLDDEEVTERIPTFVNDFTGSFVANQKHRDRQIVLDW